MIRRIKLVLPVLQEQWKRRFYIDTIKALKPNRLDYVDLFKEFSLKVVQNTEGFKISPKGDYVVFILFGSFDSKECICQAKVSQKFYAIPSWEVSKELYSEEHSKWEREHNTRMVENMPKNNIVE